MNDNTIPPWVFRLIGWIIIANIAFTIIASGALTNPWSYVIMPVVYLIARHYNRRFPYPKQPTIISRDGRQYEEINQPDALLKRYRPVEKNDGI